MSCLIVEMDVFRAKRQGCKHDWNEMFPDHYCKACGVFRLPRWFDFDEDTRMVVDPKIKVHLPYGPVTQDRKNAAR